MSQLRLNKLIQFWDFIIGKVSKLLHMPQLLFYYFLFFGGFLNIFFKLIQSKKAIVR